MSEDRTLAMGFTDERFPRSAHICLIFNSEEERRKIVSEYLAAGFEQRNLVRYFADVTAPETVRSWLSERGVDAAAAEERGAFGILSALGAYCPEGHFDPAAVIAGLKKRYVLAENAGYTASRVSGEMSWVLRNRPGSERFLEYEALLNTIDTHYPHVGVCQYDARLFDGATLFKVLQLHPYMVSKGQIVRNPDYTRPEEFLQGLASHPSRS